MISHLQKQTLTLKMWRFGDIIDSKSHIEGRHSPDLWEATAPFLSFKLGLHIASRARVAWLR